jgi:signal transduction histidine kinase
LLSYYGHLGFHGIYLAFDSANFAESRARENALSDLSHWASTLGNYSSLESSYYRDVYTKLSEPGAYFYYIERSEEKGVLSNVTEEDTAAFFASLPTQQVRKMPDERLIYVGISEERFSVLTSRFELARSNGIRHLYITLTGLILLVGGFGYALYAAGEQRDTREIGLLWIDKLYLDLGLGVYLLGVGLSTAGIISLWMPLYKTNMFTLDLLMTASNFTTDYTSATFVLGAVTAFLATLLTVLYGGMLARRLKRGEFIRHTLAYNILAALFRLVRVFVDHYVLKIFRLGPLALRAVGILVLYCASVLFSVIIMAVSRSTPLPILFGLGVLAGVNLLALKWLLDHWSRIRELVQGTERIRRGDLSCRVAETGNYEFVALSQNINNIASGLEAAVDSKVRSERMKAELITNVSHDLKTPLTSIITYVDLLKREGLASENGPRYLDVLDSKSQRLKTLTDDLFEAARAASGSIATNMERVDVGALLTQGLAELSDKVNESNLDFRVTIPPNKLYVRADGKLLWRVMENLLLNALKYSLPGSRVYVEVAAKEGLIHTTFKNVSASALNIEASELMERFKRGDESRHSEGSGLGLSIAKSLVDLQGGKFTVEIDGDLFKATVSFKSCA